VALAEGVDRIGHRPDGGRALDETVGIVVGVEPIRILLHERHVTHHTPL